MVKAARGRLSREVGTTPSNYVVVECGTLVLLMVYAVLRFIEIDRQRNRMLLGPDSGLSHLSQAM